LKYEQILALGDSTTAGCELIKDSIDWDSTKLLSFPNTLAKKLNIPCINLAWPGGSNDRSLRLLPEALLRYPNSLVLFTYTSFDRTEFFTTDESLPQVKTEGYTALGINWAIVPTIPKHKELNKLYLKHFFEETVLHNRYKSYNMMITVDLLCKTFSKNYLQIFLYDDLIHAPTYQKSVYKAIDQSHVYKFDFANDNITWRLNNNGFGSLAHWAKSKKYSFCPGGHIGQQAHDSFAMELYNIV